MTVSKDMLHTAIINESKWSNRVAVDDGKRQISYELLRKEALGLAAVLQSYGLSHGDRVGLVLNRTVDAVVSVLAVMLCGAVYVPIDPRWPDTRKKQVLNSIDARIVLFDTDIDEELLGNQEGVLCFYIDHLLSISPGINYTAPINSSSFDIAYILFTSGSKGKPKGVMVSHQAALHFSSWAADYFEISQLDKIAGVSSFSFDLSIFDVFSTLSRGATLVLYDSALLALPSSLARRLESDSITIVYTVPTLLMLLESRGRVKDRKLDCIRLIIFAGETYPIPALDRLRKALPETIKYHNLYGPTETNVCTAYEITGAEVNVIPIGRPIPGVSVDYYHSAAAKMYQSDAFELIVYGETLMSGYWGMMDGDIWRYKNDSLEKGYRTGDVCHIDSSGQLIFLGRVDSQLKINGFRIEAGEVESVLQSDPDVAQAAVFGLERGDVGYGRMKACVVIREKSVDVEALKTRLYKLCRIHLPTNVYPSEIECVDSLPTTTSGKIDRITLMKLHSSRATFKSEGETV